MLLTCVTFVCQSFSQTSNLLAINACVFIEQFGYGFGFTAYMLYLMYYADGPQKTAHYAICTGFMALGMMIPGMFAGCKNSSATITFRMGHAVQRRAGRCGVAAEDRSGLRKEKRKR